MRLFLSGLLLSVSPAALAQDFPAWELDQPAAAEMPGELEVDNLDVVAEPVWDVRISSGLTTMMTGEALLVPMPGGQSFNGQVAMNRPTASGGRHLQIEFDQPGEGVLIHVGLNATYGRIWTAGGEFVIEPGPTGGSIMRTAPEEPLFDDGITDERIHAFSGIAEADVDGVQAGSDTLDFLYFYDADMITTHGWGLPDLAATDIGNLQTALTTSGVPLFSDLTQLQFMDVAQNYPSDDLLSDAGGRNGIFTNLQARVDALGIDVISLNRVYDSDRENFCGLGYVHNPTSDFTGRSHINVCHNGLTLAHETGHNMGLAHGIETDGSTGRPVDWARGFRIDSANAEGGIFTSVMAYGSGRRPQFSDPTIRCPERGSVCGIPLDPADNSVGSFAAEALRRYAVGFPAQAIPNRRLRSSVLPTSRFVATGSAATAFMTVINPNQVEGTNCIIEHHGPNREGFSFQPTDPATNALVGTADTPVNIPAGGAQTFLISLTPAADVTGVRFAPYASCDNVPMAEVSPGLNTVDLGADAAGGPDIIALSATIGNNGIVDVPDGRRGVFSVATVNLGGAGEVTVSARSLDPDLPATGQVCQTDAAGACLASPADSLTLNVGPNDTPTFGVFVRTTYATPFSARQRFQFQTQVGGVIRGSTSVAVRDAAAIVPPGAAAHAFSVTAFGTQTGTLASHATGYFDRFEIVSPPAMGSVELNASTGSYTYTAGALGGSDSFTYRVGNSSGWSPAMAATVNVTGLPLPVVSAFTIPDDTDGTFQVDLDDHADSNIEIDRFLLTTPPSATHTFDPLSGVLSINLPSDPGSVTFQFAAENRSGQGLAASGEVNVVAYDICAPANITRSRLQRRLGEIDVTTFGSVTMAEAESLGTTLCMTETGREAGQYIRFRNTDRRIQVLISLDNTEYDIYMANDGATNWEAIFSMCKAPGQSRMTPC